MFFQRKDIGRIYVIRMELPDGFTIHKIGMTHKDRAVDRMMEILRSWFNRFRFVPYSELRIDHKCHCPAELEKHLHKMLEHRRFIPHMKVDGGSEMFIGIDEQRVLQYIRSFDENIVPHLDKLSDQDYKNLGNWISP